jgi:hypothetical protein
VLCACAELGKCKRDGRRVIGRRGAEVVLVVEVPRNSSTENSFGIPGRLNALL